MVRLSWKLYKMLFPGHAQHVMAKSHLWASKFANSSHWREIVAKTGKQLAFHENSTKRSFQVMRSTFWPNRIFERESAQNRKLAWNALQTGKTVRLPRKLYKTRFSSHARHVLAKSHLWASKFSKSWNWPKMLFKPVKQCAFHKNLQNALFRSCAARFGHIAL